MLENMRLQDNAINKDDHDGTQFYENLDLIRKENCLLLSLDFIFLKSCIVV